MKKIVALWLAFLLIFPLMACQSGDRIWIDSEIPVSETQRIVVADLETLLDQSADFVLYISSSSCSSCRDFNSILLSIITDYEIIVREIESGADFLPDNTVLPYTYYPAIVVVNDGVIVSQIDAFERESTFTSSQAFVKYLNRYVELTKK